jgi:hypothetical protein
MRMRSAGCVILSLLLLASCGPPVMETAVEEDRRAKTFADPGPSQSALYIYRTTPYAWAWPVNIRVVGSVQTPLPVDTFVRVDVTPGPNEVSCITNALPDRQRVELFAERVRYFEVSINRGDWGPFCLVREVSPEVGQQAVRGSRRIQPLYP